MSKLAADPLYVTVFGSRTFDDLPFLTASLDVFREAWGPFVLVTGTQPGSKRNKRPEVGADQQAAWWATLRSAPGNLPRPLIIEPDWDYFKKPAGIFRNLPLTRIADRLIGFWDGESPGSRNTIERVTIGEMFPRKPMFVYRTDRQLWRFYDGYGEEHDRDSLSDFDLAGLKVKPGELSARWAADPEGKQKKE